LWGGGGWGGVGGGGGGALAPSLSKVAQAREYGQVPRSRQRWWRRGVLHSRGGCTNKSARGHGAGQQWPSGLATVAVALRFASCKTSYCGLEAPVDLLLLVVRLGARCTGKRERSIANVRGSARPCGSSSSSPTPCSSRSHFFVLGVVKSNTHHIELRAASEAACRHMHIPS
jgi:hypothetical protein